MCQKVAKRLKKEGWEGAIDARDIPNITYGQFLTLLWGIKGPKMERRSLGKRLWDAVAVRYKKPAKFLNNLIIVCGASIFSVLSVHTPHMAQKALLFVDYVDHT